MGKIRKPKKIFYSLKEFEKAYFPKSFEMEVLEKPTPAREMGIRLAKESLDKIKEQITD
ncbi:MAG TPA: hypothetical protein VEK32_15445 [Thermodesulfobacteriota bacterium]|nr:hypothetical protein [Thermodesulfobacteriota bacterium]